MYEFITMCRNSGNRIVGIEKVLRVTLAYIVSNTIEHNIYNVKNLILIHECPRNVGSC
jgi:hypothetical protein